MEPGAERVIGGRGNGGFEIEAQAPGNLGSITVEAVEEKRDVVGPKPHLVGGFSHNTDNTPPPRFRVNDDVAGSGFRCVATGSRIQ